MKRQFKLLLGFGLLIAGFSLLAMKRGHEEEFIEEGLVTEKKARTEEQKMSLLGIPHELKHYHIYDQIVADAPALEDKLSALYSLEKTHPELLQDILAYKKSYLFKNQIASFLGDIKTKKLVDYLISEFPRDRFSAAEAEMLIKDLISLGMDATTNYFEVTDPEMQFLAETRALESPEEEPIEKTSYGTYLSPLYIAAYKGYPGVVKALIDMGADPNFVNQHSGATPLLVAVGKGHMEVVKELIKAGANVNTPDNDEVTPLMLAAQYGYAAIVKTLLKSGADARIVSFENKTAREYVKRGSALAGLLLEAEIKGPERMAEQLNEEEPMEEILIEETEEPAAEEEPIMLEEGPSGK